MFSKHLLGRLFTLKFGLQWLYCVLQSRCVRHDELLVPRRRPRPVPLHTVRVAVEPVDQET